MENIIAATVDVAIASTVSANVPKANARAQLVSVNVETDSVVRGVLLHETLQPATTTST